MGDKVWTFIQESDTSCLRHKPSFGTKPMRVCDCPECHEEAEIALQAERDVTAKRIEELEYENEKLKKWTQYCQSCWIWKCIYHQDVLKAEKE